MLGKRLTLEDGLKVVVVYDNSNSCDRCDLENGLYCLDVSFNRTEWDCSDNPVIYKKVLTKEIK